MATVSYQLKHSFFDRKKVIDKVGKVNARNLSKFGAFVRRNARTKQLRRRKAVSSPGSPPSVHSKDKVATLKNILFGLEGKHTVVIGPVGLNGRGEGLSAGTVPGTLEHGGTGQLREKKVGKQWRPAGRRQARPGQPVRTRTVKYAPRKFMLPALQAEVSKFPGLWANSIEG